MDIAFILFCLTVGIIACVAIALMAPLGSWEEIMGIVLAAIFAWSWLCVAFKLGGG